MVQERSCSVPFCDGIRWKRTWCRKHYKRWQKHGNPNRLSPFDLTPEQRFWSRVDLLGSCWQWLGCVDKDGYGAFSLRGGEAPVRVHRWAYEQLIGPIPEGLVIDHLCRNQACVKPDHLEVVSVRENTIRGSGWTAVNAAKTHCPAGHAYDAANTRINAQGARECRICGREAVARYAARRAGAVAR